MLRMLTLKQAQVTVYLSKLYYTLFNSLLRKAFCASLVIASASSRIISLKPDLKIVRVLAKFKICPRTIPIPLSSEALSSRTCKIKGAVDRLGSFNFLDYRQQDINQDRCGFKSSTTFASNRYWLSGHFTE